MDTTRVAVVTFADAAEVWVDQVTSGNIHEHKCSLLGTSLPNIDYALVEFKVANKNVFKTYWFQIKIFYVNIYILLKHYLLCTYLTVIIYNLILIKTN